MASPHAHRFRVNFLLYLYEAAELAIFMISACVATDLLFHAGAPAIHWIPCAALRRAIMGIAMGLTAVFIIRSPMGKRSGAHFNPAITLTYYHLGKVAPVDAIFYVLFQFLGGAAGVGLSALLLGSSIAAPSVNYAVTVPGIFGIAGAFAAETFMAALLMGVVLFTSNRPALARHTSALVGVLIAFYILLFAPVSGFSINPARTTGSAVFAHVFTAIWVYFTAPLLGMFAAAEVYVRSQGADRIVCAMLHPAPLRECPFLCNHPLHQHPAVVHAK